MRCTRCSAELPAQSRFCLKCGTPVQATASYTPSAPPASPVQAASLAAPNSNRGILIALALLTLAVLGLSAMVFKGRMVQAPSQTTGSGLVQAPGAFHPSPLVEAPGTSQPPPPLVQNSTEAAPQPTDIMDYLKFLKDIENKRRGLCHQEASDLKAMITKISVNQLNEGLRGTNDTTANGDPKVRNLLPDSGASITQMHTDWDNLTRLFNTKTPPKSCIDLRDKYLSQLGKTEAELTKAYGLFDTMAKDPSNVLNKAYSMEGQSGDIDAGLASADEELARVCNQYHISKDFDIKDGESGGDVGNVMGGAGL